MAISLVPEDCVKINQHKLSQSGKKTTKKQKPNQRFYLAQDKNKSTWEEEGKEGENKGSIIFCIVFNSLLAVLWWISGGDVQQQQPCSSVLWWFLSPSTVLEQPLATDSALELAAGNVTFRGKLLFSYGEKKCIPQWFLWCLWPNLLHPSHPSPPKSSSGLNLALKENIAESQVKLHWTGCDDPKDSPDFLPGSSSQPVPVKNTGLHVAHHPTNFSPWPNQAT